MLSQQSGPTYYARLQFADAASCVAWIETIPLTSAIDAHEMVSAQIELLGRAEMAPLEKLRSLELLYQTATHLQAEMARKFIGHALPLSIVEYSVWNSVLALWQAMFKCYQFCLRSYLRGEVALAPHAPLLALRCLDLTAASIREHHAVYREVPSQLWKQLNECYASAERHGLAATGVADPLSPSVSARTCVAAYGRALLAHLSNPYAMSPRQMDVMYRWVALWDALVALRVSPQAPGTTGSLAVDLHSGTPAVSAREIDAGPSVRYIELEQLGLALRRVLTQLRRGDDPASLGLGEDIRQPGCERLLTLLYIQWCGSGMAPIIRSRERGEDARACVGFEYVLRQLASENEAFRAAAATIRTAYSAFTEHWNVISVNAPGFIGVARGPECDERIRHHQLVAIKRRSLPNFQLAVAQWLKLEDDGDLSIGLRLLPGVPHVTALRAVDDEPSESGETGNNPPGSAVLLPAVGEMRAAATLVLDPGVFRPGRVLELLSGSLRRVRLIRLAERGVDFERAVFELIA